MERINEGIGKKERVMGALLKWAAAPEMAGAGFSVSGFAVVIVTRARSTIDGQRWPRIESPYQW